MLVGLIFLGALSFTLAYIWHSRIKEVNLFIEDMKLEHGNPDISGKTQYTDCKSHRWVIRNVVVGDYSKAGEGFRNFMMNRTLIGTLVLSTFLGLIPVIIVYFLFQSFNLIGVSLVLIFIAVYIVRSPGNVEISNRLVRYLTKDEETEITLGDIAYATISQRTMESWRTKLVLLGMGSVILAPWGEQIPVAVIWVFTQFIGWLYLSIFVTLSPISMPLALVLYIAAAPAIFSVIYLTVRLITGRYRTHNPEGLNIIDDSGIQT